MTTPLTTKKPASSDWHVADIKAALEKKGWSLSRLAFRHGYCRTAAAMSLYRPWPKMERLIADAIGVSPQDIWPSRYHADGSPKSGRNERGLGRYKCKSNSAARGRNVKEKPAA